ncbi:MAG: ABC transporter ATP-binding protein [Deferrisomatales bacterium]|nr:ABC transporter ATP-binding protein [Deferrisomatales bacterium]
MGSELLSVSGLEARYGLSQVLFGMSLEVEEGQCVSLLGRNGMGKTTTLRCITGLMRPAAGEIRFGAREITGWPAYRVAKAGMGLVPEGRHVFPNLTVRENLVATAANRTGRPSPWTLGRIYQLFPRLEERAGNLGSNLSGGEQQMLAIGRALLTNPRLLILDEATEGLAPLVRREIWSCLARLKTEGQAILVVDKNVDALGRIGDRHYVLQKGRVVWSGTSAELGRDRDAVSRYLSV